jgi:hypothetical protein
MYFNRSEYLYVYEYIRMYCISKKKYRLNKGMLGEIYGS